VALGRSNAARSLPVIEPVVYAIPRPLASGAHGLVFFDGLIQFGSAGFAVSRWFVDKPLQAMSEGFDRD
jgi:hypothetical protein